MQKTRSLPKRQSCDRCHKQKLRCLRPSNGESGACERCNRLKTQCIYSASLPKGRPRGARGTASVIQKLPESNAEKSTAADSGHSAVDAGMITNVVQHPDSTDTAMWNDSMPVDWMDHVDSTFADPEQWQFELPDLGNTNDFLDYNTVESSFTSPDILDSVSGPQIYQSAIRADSHQNSTPKKVEPKSAMAVLSRLSQRLYSLYSAVLELTNHPDAIDQADTAALQKGPFADDSAFQKLTSWLVRASSNMNASSVSTAEQESKTPAATDDGCALLENVFSASQKLIDTLHSLREEASRLDPVPQNRQVPGILNQHTDTTGRVPGDDGHPTGGPSVSSNHWSDSITRHMVMANHMLLMNTYLAAVMALQHAVNKQKSASESPNAQDFSLPLGEMRTAMVVQMCGYLMQRQVNAVQVYLAPPDSLSLSTTGSPDHTAMRGLEKDVQERLARLKGSLPG